MKKPGREISIEVIALFELIRGGLHKEYVPRAECFERVEWAAIIRLAQQQTVLGVAWDGLLKLPVELMPAKAIKLQWYALVQRIERSNLLINNVVAKIYALFEQADINVVMFKGQVVAQLYPEPLHRQCGDIDIYAEGEDFAKSNEILATLSGTSAEQNTIDHNHYVVDGVTIELHHKLIGIYGRKKRKSFASELSLNYPIRLRNLSISEQNVSVFEDDFAEAYVLLHLYKHLILFGVGLRQVIDWAYCSTQLKEQSVVLDEYNSVREKLSSIAVDYLGFSADSMPYYSPSQKQKRTKSLLAIIFKDGNFGHNNLDKRSKKDAPKIIAKSNSAWLMVSRWLKVSRIIPGDSLTYLLGSIKDLVFSALTGKKH